MVYFLFVETNVNLSLELHHNDHNMNIDGFQLVLRLVEISKCTVGGGRKVFSFNGFLFSPRVEKSEEKCINILEIC